MNKEILHEIDLEQQISSPKGDNIVPRDFSLISDVDVNIKAQIGTSTLSVQDLFNLKKGGLVTLNEKLDAPILLFLDNKLIAEGKLVVVDDYFGIEILEIRN